MSIKALGFLRISSPKRAEWESYARDLLGAAVQVEPSLTTVGLDERCYRLSIADGEQETVEGIGWEVANAQALGELAGRLESKGFAVKPVDAAEAKELKVSGMLRVVDPSGYTLEVYHGQRQLTGEVQSGRPVEFVTGDLGFGHIVLGTSSFEETVAFYTDVLGFRVSDTLMLGRSRTIFLHCNARHHSLALVETKTSFVHHIMFEVSEVDMVGYAFDLFRDREQVITMDLGRHSNDKMFSFYAKTPSGFEIEYGHGGLLVDDATWSVTEYSGPSLWGHRRGGK
jgi:2,3-dihydroxybiphenyl 1,2-dioxygenase